MEYSAPKRSLGQYVSVLPGFYSIYSYTIIQYVSAASWAVRPTCCIMFQLLRYQNGMLKNIVANNNSKFRISNKHNLLSL